MSKRALKKKRAELEALLTDRYEALGEVVLGMHGRGEWDDKTLARGAAEVREVITELDSLDLEEPTDSPESAAASDDRAELADPLPVGIVETGETESRADHLLAETAEHRMDAQDELSADTPGRGDGGSDDDGVEQGGPDRPAEPEPDTEIGSKADSESGPAGFGAGETTGDRAQTKPGPDAPPVHADVDPADGRDGSDEPPGEAAGEPPNEGENREGTSDPASAGSETSRPEKGALAPPVIARREGVGRELDSVATRIDEKEREAKVASEAARAALQADSKTELSAITRAIEDERASLERALEVAAKRIRSAELEAENARARLTRELASNREAAAAWVRDQADEIEADAALAQELATTSFEDEAGGLGGDAGEARMQAMESEITSLKANLEAEKASKAEALAKAEVRVREIEASAREAERKVDEARKWAPEEARLEDRRAQEAELREAAVLWLRGQVAAVREQGEAQDESASRTGEGDDS